MVRSDCHPPFAKSAKDGAPAGANILSMDVIKKAQEIQELAKRVQDKVKNAY